ncbi:MAG TPA: thioredoxin family protein [Planctomycetota bacterium]|nr:thioredoxin family protein [Planctomycetota bacterium]
MKRTKLAILTAAVLVAITPALRAQSLEELKAAKLKEEFFKKADWILDYDQAREEAKKSGKVIFTYFSRSYSACPACHALEAGALITDDFAKFAKDYILYCHITTMIPGEKYGDLLEQKGGHAFPFLVFMDAGGDVIVEHEGERSASAFTSSGEKARGWLALKDKAAKGDAAAKIDFAILQLSMGQAKPEEAQKTIQEAGALSKEQQAKLDAELVNAEIRIAVRAVRNDEQAAELGKKYYARMREGKPAPTADNAIQAYYMLGMDAAAEAKDAATFETAYKVLFEKYGKMEGAGAFFEAKQKQLKELQEKK